MDQSRDLSGQQQHRLTQLVRTPDFVKQATAVDVCGEPDMGSELYADPVHRLFPCHTAAATWTSTAFFLTKRAEFKRDDAELIDGRLQQYTEYHRIPNAIQQLRFDINGLNKEAEAPLPDDAYALVFHDGVELKRHYPLRNGLEVKKAAEYLHKNRDFLAYPLRRDFADKVMQKAAAYGVNLAEHCDFIERQAGYGACTAKQAVDMLQDRVNASRKGPGALSETQTELLKLAGIFARYPSRLREPGIRVKLASVVASFDEATGLHHQYGEQLLRPEDVLFELTHEKMASAVQDHVSNPTTGAIYKLADLERVRTADVRSHLGDELADAVAGLGGYVDSEKAAAIIPTMDRGFAKAFDRMLTTFGVLPMAKEASAEAIGYSHAYLTELAQSYHQAVGSS